MGQIHVSRPAWILGIAESLYCRGQIQAKGCFGIGALRWSPVTIGRPVFSVKASNDHPVKN